MIKIKNDTQMQIEVSVSKWDNAGDSSYFKIQPGKTETWKRKDDRGFIIALAGNTARFYLRTLYTDVRITSITRATASADGYRDKELKNLYDI